MHRPPIAMPKTQPLTPNIPPVRELPTHAADLTAFEKTFCRSLIPDLSLFDNLADLMRYFAVDVRKRFHELLRIDNADTRQHEYMIRLIHVARDAARMLWHRQHLGEALGHYTPERRPWPKNMRMVVGDKVYDWKDAVKVRASVSGIPTWYDIEPEFRELELELRAQESRGPGDIDRGVIALVRRQLIALKHTVREALQAARNVAVQGALK